MHWIFSTDAYEKSKPNSTHSTKQRRQILCLEIHIKYMCMYARTGCEYNVKTNCLLLLIYCISHAQLASIFSFAHSEIVLAVEIKIGSNKSEHYTTSSIIDELMQKSFDINDKILFPGHESWTKLSVGFCLEIVPSELFS